ncbi:MAG: hypothetical protein V7K38_06995 [Nostoc sp.]|uniref:hypothetical protein n=1 Tax=Nostoc sp. TaxID=1180 RepID=UPI002FFA03A9
MSRTLEAKNIELQQLTEQLEQRVTQRTQELFTSVEAFKQTQQFMNYSQDSYQYGSVKVFIPRRSRQPPLKRGAYNHLLPPF